MTNPVRTERPAPPFGLVRVLAVLQVAIENDAVALVGEDDAILLWSRGLEGLTGVMAADVMGKPATPLLTAWGVGPTSCDVDETINLRVGAEPRVRWRRFALSQIDGGGPLCVHSFVAEARVTPNVDAQLLRYATDLASTQQAKRETERDLATALADLQASCFALEEANRKLEHRRAQLSLEVAGKLDELSFVEHKIKGVVAPEGTFHGMRSGAPNMRSLFQTVRQVGPTAATVHLWGESGTGKELLARALHAESDRRDGPFVAVNCAALTTTLAESQLFGHVKGAFTGAHQRHDGLFVQAHNGTLFLDEIAEMPLLLQSKLLRAIQEGEVTPVGGNGPVKVNCRILSATHRNLAAEVEAGRFREDLMYRLRVVPLTIPPLRDRPGDVEVMVRALLERNNATGMRQVTSVEPEAVRTMIDYNWPGNVRELENTLQYAFAVGTGAVLRAEHLPIEVRERTAAVEVAALTVAAGPTKATATPSEAERIGEALAATGGKITEAAQMLGMSRATFYRKRRQYKL